MSDWPSTGGHARRGRSRPGKPTRQADQPPALLANLTQRQANEANAQTAARGRSEALAALAQAAVGIGAAMMADDLVPADADRLTAALQRWNRQRDADLRQSQQDQREWASLQNLHAGRTAQHAALVRIGGGLLLRVRGDQRAIDVHHAPRPAAPAARRARLRASAATRRSPVHAERITKPVSAGAIAGAAVRVVLER